MKKFEIKQFDEDGNLTAKVEVNDSLGLLSLLIVGAGREVIVLDGKQRTEFINKIKKLEHKQKGNDRNES